MRRNSILMTRHYPDLGRTSDWSNQISNAARPIRSTTQTRVVTRHQHGFSALVSQTSFRGETSGGVAKCRLFSQARFLFHFCTAKTENPVPSRSSVFLCSETTRKRLLCRMVSSGPMHCPKQVKQQNNLFLVSLITFPLHPKSRKKSKIRERNLQISFFKMPNNKHHHEKELLKRFHLNGHTMGFHPHSKVRTTNEINSTI